MTSENLLKLVLGSFEAERQNDVTRGLELVADDFKATEMSMGNRGNVLFPYVSAGTARKSIGEVYQIKDRKYQFVNAMADESKQTVMIEFVESYPNPKTGQLYLTPQVAVCEVRDNKIYRTRHYNDPRVPFSDVTQQDVDSALA